MKKVLFPQPDSNPGPSTYEAAVLLTELHHQSENYLWNRVLYSKHAFFRLFLASFLLNKVSPTIFLVPVTVPVPIPSLTSVPRRTNHSLEKEKEIPRLLQTTLQDISCETDESHVGQSSLMWDRVVSKGTEQSHRVQSSLKWDRAVSYGTEQYHMRMSSLLWDIEVSYGTE